MQTSELRALLYKGPLICPMIYTYSNLHHEMINSARDMMHSKKFQINSTLESDVLEYAMLMTYGKGKEAPALSHPQEQVTHE